MLSPGRVEATRMIETLEDAERRLLHERATRARRAFRRAVRPIYAVAGDGPNPIMQHIGSCILLSIDGHRVVATAAHVLDNRAHGLLSVGGVVGTHPVPIVDGMLRTTTAPLGDRQRDANDCGFWLIPEAALATLGAVEFLDASRISHNRASSDHRYYMAMGYRRSRNKKTVNHRRKAIETRASTYSGSLLPIPEPAKKLGFLDGQHFFLHFDECAEDEAGAQVNAFGPRGFSGGALVDLGDFRPAQVYASADSWRPLLSGMLIEHRDDYRGMALS